MDGQNLGNGQNNYYQDNTANIPYQPYTDYSENGSGNANSTQIASLVLGIVSICLACCSCGVGLFGSLPAVVLGIVGLICALMGNKENKHGIGIAGLVCSVIGLVFGFILIIITVLSLLGFAAISSMEDLF